MKKFLITTAVALLIAAPTYVSAQPAAEKAADAKAPVTQEVKADAQADALKSCAAVVKDGKVAEGAPKELATKCQELVTKCDETVKPGAAVPAAEVTKCQEFLKGGVAAPKAAPAAGAPKAEEGAKH